MSSGSVQSRTGRGHRRAKTTCVNFQNELAQLHLDDNLSADDVMMRFRRSSFRTNHLVEVSKGSKEATLEVRRRIEEVALISGTQFDEVISRWDELPILANGDMPVDSFIEAYKMILYVLDAFGGAFLIIKQDLKSQMAKVREQCTRHALDTVLRMAEKDGKNGKGTFALLWLKRTMQFTEVMLGKMLTGIPLPEAVDYAYQNTLYYAHPFVVRAIAKNIRFATPDTQTFLSRIYKDDTNLVTLGIGEFLIALRPRLATTVKFFNKVNYEDFEPLRALPTGYS